MASDQIVVINQLASRLENATSTERIDALQDLQSLAKVNPDLVGSFSLKKVLDFLQEQGSAEEYQEALDLIYRLVKCRDKVAAASNANIILGDTNAVELLLDLLNHEDLTVGVMTSQILTEIHAANGPSLELQIQQCPDGMNKLLQRLPDSSREEVRNQAIVLIQQLTSTNEEMKKTVVFNEGFEILFGIIQREGGFEDAGLVVQDCLFICNNILSDSETCQRLFFAMGSDWILRLADFFDPSLLESIETSNFSLGMEDDDEDGPGQNSEGWFDDPARLACAVLALASLYCSLSTPNKKHQVTLATSTSVVIPSAAFWVARRGPSELVNAGLSLLSRLVEGGNVEIANLLSNSYIKVSPAVARKNFPADVDLPQLVFGWKPLPGDDRKFISILSLLAERYIYPADAWNPREGTVLGAKLKLRFDVQANGAENLAKSSLLVFEQILAADPSISDLLVQYILAPPPPPHLDGVSADDDEFGSQQLESMRPLGLQVLSLLVEGCNKILDGASKSPSFETAERAANVLSVMFLHGSQLAKELSTAVTITHIGNGMGKPLPLSSHAGSHKCILPLLLFTAGRIARSAGGAGYPLLVSFLRLLACVVSDCEFAAKQVLEDPAILTVVMDLATTTSESAGVPSLVQVAAALFLGCCFQALPSPSSSSPPPTTSSSDDATLNRKSFLSMLDSRVGLTRITALLKLPVEAPGRSRTPGDFSALFITPDVQTFVHKQVEAIRAGIFEFYTAGSESAPGDVLQQKVIEMQNEKIAELEQRLAAYTSGVPVSDVAPVDAAVVAELENKLATAEEGLRHEKAALAEKEALELNLKETVRSLEDANSIFLAEAHRNNESAARLEALVDQKSQELTALQAQSLQVEELLQAKIEELNGQLRIALESEAERQTEFIEVKATIQAHADEVLSLKQSIVTGHQENKQLKENLEQRDRKIELLMDELRASQPVDNSQSDRKIADLEARNSDLKAQVWELESQLKTAQEEHKSATMALAVPAPSDTMSDVSLVTSPPPALLYDPSFEAVSSAAIALVRQLGIADELSDFQFVENTLRGAEAEAAQRHRLVEELLHQCSESLSNAINECSDIAEQAGIHDLEGDEGSVLRFLDCCHKLRENILDASQHTQDMSEIEQLKLQIEFLEQQLNDAEGVISDKGEQLRVLENALEESVAETARLQERQEAQDTTTTTNSEASLFREEFHALEAQCETLRAQAAALEGDLSQAKENVARAESALQQHASDEVQSHRDEMARLQEELGAEKRLISSLQMQLGEAESDAAQVEAMLRQQINEADSAHQAEVVSLRDELGAQQTQLEEQQLITEKMAALHAEMGAMRQEAEASQTTIATLQEQLQRAQEIPIHVHSREADELREKLSTQAASHEEHVRHLEHEIEILKSSWREAETAAAAAASTIETLQNEVSQLQEKAENDAENVATQVSELNALLAVSKEKASAAEQASEDLQVELEGIRKASNQSTEEIRAELEHVRHDLIQHEHKLAQSVAENERLKAEAVAHLDEFQLALEAQHAEDLSHQVRAAEQKLSEVKEGLEQQLEDAWGEMDILRKDLLQKMEVAEAAHVTEKEVWSTEREALLQQVANAAAQLENVAKTTESGASQLAAVRSAAQQEIAALQAQLSAREFATGADVLENALLRAQINTTEDVLAQLEDGYSAVGTRCAAAESENAALASEREALSQSVEQVQAQLDALHMQYESETLVLKESHDKQSQQVRQLEAELERVKQETEDELTVSDKKYADLLLSLEDLDAKTASQSKIVLVLQEEVADRTAQEDTLRAEIVALQQALDGERAVVAELRATYEASASSLDALQSQAQELRRLSQSVDHLSREVHAKDQQIATLSTQLRRREGEAAGVLTTFESVKADIALLREENERLADKYVAENKSVQERDRKIRTLQTQLEAEQSEVEQLRAKSQTDRVVSKYEATHLSQTSTELVKRLESALSEFVAWVITTYKITDYKVVNALQADGSRLLTISTAISAHTVLDAFKLIEVLRNCITWLVEGRDLELRDKAKSLSDKEQELVNLRRILIAFESSDQQHAEKVLMHTPVRGSNAQHHHHTTFNGASEQHLPASLHTGALVSTPEAKAPPSSSAYNSSLAMTPSGGKTRWSGAQSAIQHASPAAKQAAKLHSEVLKERSKLAALQEQHSDLLGLLAQQDVELSVFREVIQSRLGQGELTSVEDVARANTIDLYGSYTQFRYDL